MRIKLILIILLACMSLFGTKSYSKNDGELWEGADTQAIASDMESIEASMQNFSLYGKNLFNPDERIDGYLISNSTGELVESVSRYSSGWIQIIGDRAISRSLSTVDYYAFYDEDKIYISGGLVGFSYTNSPIAPANAVYFRTSTKYDYYDPEEFQIEIADTLTSFVSYTKADTPVPLGDVVYEGSRDEPNGFAGLESNGKIKKNKYLNLPSTYIYTAFGDSNTAGYVPRNSTDNNWGGEVNDSYAKLAADSLGATFENRGISGATVAGASGSLSLVEMYSNPDIPDDTNIITIMGGTNDCRTGVVIGDITSRDQTEFYGALHIIITGLMERFVYANDMLGSVINTQVADATHAQVDTGTLTGTKGDCYIRATGGLHKHLEFNTSLTQTAADFVTNYASEYAAEGIDITSSGADIIFTAQAVNTPFASPVVLQGQPKRLGTKIILCTPLKLGIDYQSAYAEGTMEDYCDAIKAVAAYYSLPVFDTQNISMMNPHIHRVNRGWQGTNLDLYNPIMPDGTHLSAEGHIMLGNIMTSFIKGLF